MVAQIFSRVASITRTGVIDTLTRSSSTLSDRTNWISTRFGDVPKYSLGELSELNPMVWPEIEREYTS